MNAKKEKALTKEEIQKHKLKKGIDLPVEMFTDETDFGKVEVAMPTTAAAGGVITIGRSGQAKVTSNAVAIDLLLYNPNLEMRFGAVKWQLYLSQPNLYNVRLENLHPMYNNHKLIIDNYQPNNFNIWLLSKSKQVTDAPIELIPIMATLKMDRLPNAPFGWGSTPDCYIVEQVNPLSNIFI